MGIYDMTDLIIDPTRYPWGFSLPWTPAEITTALWLDAADSDTITLVSGTVSEWADKSGNSRHATQGTSSLRPVVTSNGIDFGTAGSDKRLVNTASNFTPDSIFVACRWNGGSTFPAFNGLFTASTTSGTHNGILIIGTLDTTSFHTANGQPIFVNGVQDAQMESMGSISPGIVGYVQGGTVTPGYCVGHDRGHIESLASIKRNWRGLVYECVVLGHAVTETDRQRIEGYLAHKWNLAANLPSGHPYKTSAPTVQ